MRVMPKVYHDENYRDPVPVAVCPICGEPIYQGDPCYQLDTGELVHGDGIFRDYQEKGTKRPLRLSCAMAYILDTASQDDLAEALGIPEKRWV